MLMRSGPGCGVRSVPLFEPGERASHDLRCGKSLSFAIGGIGTVPRYVALLRGVSPTNCQMPRLKACFQAAGFEDVRTVLSSGNVAFSTHGGEEFTSFALEQQAEDAMVASLGRSFPTVVRSREYLQALLASDPFAVFNVPPTAKCVVTFLRRLDDRRVALPIERDGVRILKQTGTEVFTTYEPSPRGPVFMTLIERAFGKDVTTRTLATVARCAAA